MPSRNFEAQMNIAIPLPILLAGVLLPFVMGYADTSFLLGFFLSALIFMTTFTLKLEDIKSDEDEKPSEEPVDESQGLAFYLREGGVEVRTQDGRAYRWKAEAEGLNLMTKGGVRCGVFHTQDDLAFLEFWDPEVSLYQAALNPWASSTDVITHVKDFQIAK